MSVADNAQAIAEILQGCVDGKTAIAQAITSKGVATAADASFDTMAVNVGLIEGGGVVGRDINTIAPVPNRYISKDGDEVAYATWTSTGFIPVPAGCNSVVVDGELNEYRAAYDITGSFIGAFSVFPSTIYNSPVIVLPEGTAYVRFSSTTNTFSYHIYPIRMEV